MRRNEVRYNRKNRRGTASCCRLAGRRGLLLVFFAGTAAASSASLAASSASLAASSASLAAGAGAGVAAVGGSEQQQQVEEEVTMRWLSSSLPLPWSPEKYPDINENPEPCGGGGGGNVEPRPRRLCDPDGILRKEERASVERLLVDHPVAAIAKDRYSRGRSGGAEEEEDNSAAKLQIAVALVRKMDLPAMGEQFVVGQGHATKAAEVFARYVHNSWGVGNEVSAGGTGILVFLSELDRALYISRGAALEPVLTDRRLDYVIQRVMRPILQQQRYGDALVSAVETLLAMVDSGEPGTYEKMADFAVEYGWVVAVALVFGYALWNARQIERRKREYARVASYLHELDCAKAQALQGKYRTTSCPICLEAFQVQEDDLGNHDCDHSAGDGDNLLQQQQTQKQGHQPMTGSDGMPVKQLRCGHVFDHSCFNEWINSGNCNVDKCPICRADVGGTRGSKACIPSLPWISSLTQRTSSNGSNTNGGANNGGGGGDYGRPDTSELLAESVGNIPTSSTSSSSSSLRLYNYERNFRLMRIGLRYPQIVNPSQISRWTDSTYSDSLVRDPIFVRSDPSRSHADAGIGGGKNSSGADSGFGGGGFGTGFGGGSSGGGRGGSW